MLAYLARYTHRAAISNSRLIALDDRGVTFRVKDYRRNGRERIRGMTLDPGEFIRRFLLHVLPPMDGPGASTASATPSTSRHPKPFTESVVGRGFAECPLADRKAAVRSTS